VPVPGARLRLEAGHVLVLPHVGVRRIVAAADVVAKDVVAQAVRGVGHLVDEGVAVGRRPAAHVIRPPAEAGPPPLERLMTSTGVDDDQRGPRGCRDLRPGHAARAARARAGRTAAAHGTRATAFSAHGDAARASASSARTTGRYTGRASSRQAAR